ncbi:DNA replication and repair protein RecN [Salsuginibacillus halophilus]|uniref:DNA repair protein RecN n=1 Tax=Salsuginibacillus halophilus TaxID=517424 RepID=A0A2P8HAF3_9BACI|nr:DNA repair protein RecN [Salsuginibacillus halophilus]PSL43205.1 DNA replication and repair protein RecN [Salsuginibacillus halophilus]
MLEEITIKNVAVIEEVTLSFEQGLTVLTGETGAGKSIIIDSLALLAGGRGSVDYVRHGADRAEIEGLFTVEENSPARARAEAAGIEIEENMVVLRREVTHKGKSICRINNKLVTLAVLREVGQGLIDIHGQHEHQELLQSERHLHLLDKFAGDDLKKALADYQSRFQDFKRTQEKLEQLQENDQENAHRLDLIEYQLGEIVQAELSPGEDEQLEKEKHILSHSESLYDALSGAYNSLYGEGRGLDWVSHALGETEAAAAVDDRLGELQESVANAYYALEEATFSLREHSEALAFDPERLHEVESRLNEIDRLKRKYGSTVDEILEYAAKVEEERDLIVNKDENIQAYEAELEQKAADLAAEADTLTDLRRQAALRLSETVEGELGALHMPNASLTVEFSLAERGSSYTFENGRRYFTANGQEKVEFMLSTNAGEPEKPLAKIASGGEISRIMLALKTVLSGFQQKVALIFDEVDTGVSGRVAQAIAAKIQEAANDAQVLCITHLPQVAAMADEHFLIEKSEEDARVYTTVEPMSSTAATEEIARMISGTTVTEASLENARELIAEASAVKS